MDIAPAGKVPTNVGFLTPVSVNVIGVLAYIVFAAVADIKLDPIFTVETAVVLLELATAGGPLNARFANYGGKLI
jgi:hypothetical protein